MIRYVDAVEFLDGHYIFYNYYTTITSIIIITITILAYDYYINNCMILLHGAYGLRRWTHHVTFASVSTSAGFRVL